MLIAVCELACLLSEGGRREGERREGERREGERREGERREGGRREGERREGEWMKGEEGGDRREGEGLDYSTHVRPVCDITRDTTIKRANWGERERAPSCGLNGRAVTIYIYIYIRPAPATAHARRYAQT